MIRTIIITIITLVSLITFIIFKPFITLNFKKKKITLQSYSAIATIGALIMLIFGCVTKDSLKELINFKSQMNPFKILILFISISLLSIVLEKAGFFELCVSKTTQKVKHSQIKLFIFLYSLVAFLTMFTSNDIIILTFTPFIIYFSKQKGISPIPYLVGEFVAANTLSLMFIIGNPTNIYIATYYNISFFEYFKVMWLPTLMLSLIGFIVVFLLFLKELKKPITLDKPLNKITYNKQLIIVGLIHLIVCTICLVVSSYIHFDMWYICLAFAVSISIYIFVYDIIKHEHKEIEVYKSAPWSLIPFVISMFIIVLALKQNGILEQIAMLFNNLFSLNSFKETFGYGFSSFFACSLINNIPMSVAYSSILELSSSSSAAIYATIIGSNIGAILSPVGALAGIMWLNYLKKWNINYHFFTFLKNGVIISIPILTVGLIILILMLL